MNYQNQWLFREQLKGTNCLGALIGCQTTATIDTS